jgi:hypothetical protein
LFNDSFFWKCDLFPATISFFFSICTHLFMSLNEFLYASLFFLMAFVIVSFHGGVSLYCFFGGGLPHAFSAGFTIVSLSSFHSSDIHFHFLVLFFTSVLYFDVSKIYYQC